MSQPEQTGPSSPHLQRASMNGAEMVAAAEAVAREAHDDQFDKSGAPYWTHPARVAANVRELYPDATDDAVAAAWLHDVIEDTAWTAETLRHHGFPATVVETVEALTRREGAKAPTGYDYYAGIVVAGEVALQVKHADITDNLNEERFGQLDPATQDRLRAKYANALNALGLSG